MKEKNFYTKSEETAPLIREAGPPSPTPAMKKNDQKRSLLAWEGVTEIKARKRTA